VQRKPILANSCALAASAKESRFRIDAPVTETRLAAVVALDSLAKELVGSCADACSVRARLLQVGKNRSDDLALEALEGHPSNPGATLEGVELAVLVASSDDASGPAARIGEYCETHAITTAGVVARLGGRSVTKTVRALRPWVSLLLVSDDGSDLQDILNALRV